MTSVRLSKMFSVDEYKKMSDDHHDLWAACINGHYAVQGHSRSPNLVPIENSYTTISD